MNLDAFILIGGRSSRLGTDKAFVELGGQTLAERAANTVEQAFPNVNIRFVVGEEQQFRGDLIFKLGRPVVADLKPGFGAWSGLHTAISYAKTEWVFVLACDMPFVSTHFISFLADRISQNADAVAAKQNDGRLQPLCAFYRRAATLPFVEKILSGKAVPPSANTIFDKLKSRIIEPADYSHISNAEYFFLNINTEHDLAEAIATV